MLYSFVKSMIEFRSLAEKENVELRQFKDIFYVVISAGVCFLLRFGFDCLSKQWIMNRIEAQGLTDTEFRVQKSLKQAKDIIYYAIVLVGWLFLS